jgi:hypothetical protein
MTKERVALPFKLDAAEDEQQLPVRLRSGCDSENIGSHADTLAPGFSRPALKRMIKSEPPCATLKRCSPLLKQEAPTAGKAIVRRESRSLNLFSGAESFRKSFGMMAGTTGLEPATSAVTGQRSNQLSYVPRLVHPGQRQERVYQKRKRCYYEETRSILPTRKM